MLPEPDCRFDQDLAEWFSRRGGAWSGTAGELLASLGTSPSVGSGLGPQSSGALYSYLQSHRQILQSLGVDVLLHNGVPRMVSLRSCRGEPPQRKPASSAFDNDRKSDRTIKPASLVTGPKSSSADSIDTDLAGSEALNRDIPIAKSDLSRQGLTKKDTGGNGPKEVFFVNTGEALFAIVDMRRQIREQGLDLESAVDLVIGRAQQITRSFGIAVGFLPQEIGSQFRTGIATSRKQPEFHANLFQSSLVAGEAVQLPDAQKHPLLGATCRREGIGSLIVVPIFRNREVAGAIEFFFQEKRSFSPGDVMDLGLIAGVISESLGGSKQMAVKHTSGPMPEAETKIMANVEPQEPSVQEEVAPSDLPPGPVRDTISAETPLAESSTPEPVIPASLAAKSDPTSTGFWLGLKKWIRNPRQM